MHAPQLQQVQLLAAVQAPIWSESGHPVLAAYPCCDCKHADVLQVPLLAALDASQRSELCKALKPRLFNAGETIVRKGEPGEFFYVVESGECVVVGDSGQVCAVLCLLLSAVQSCLPAPLC